MNIAILSDSHDNWEKLEKAVNEANVQDCEVMFFAGDLIAPYGITLLKSFQGQVHVVFGNNEMEKTKITRMADATKNVVLYEDLFCECELENKKIFMNHYPRFSQLAFTSGKFDICIYGHDHLYHEEKSSKNRLLINPGEIQGFRSGNSTFAIVDTQTNEVKKILLNSL